MISVLKTLLSGGGRAPEPQAPEPQLAVAALLVEAGRADGSYDPNDKAAVAHLLEDMFDLTPDQAEKLRQRGEDAQRDASDLVRFTRVVKYALDEQERIALIEALWHVVLVDHHRAPHEDALLRRLPPLIGVDDHFSTAARQRVMARAGIGRE
ncbi:MAG: tellurite resistance TerB family protein [Pararhodobacter sp.]